ncbi:MAG TPA: lipoprotein signal peptidase [Thiolapillus brandeum]|uniref:Lipoprotein signal peptidase n=1 Tax=Thiolapillus brandeum TaxID=1076588 RepID=A0A831W7V7_9GAMM|nr:lipoprotein signal peptidase [Thiolapillus brandeum]
MADRLRPGGFLLLALLVLVLDQASKAWVMAVFQPYEVLPVLPVFNLTLVFNEGAAFSFLSNAGGWQRWFFVGLTSLISLGLLVWLLRLKASERLTGLALALILGGALGNLVDRLRLGKVTDFLDFHWQGWHWPAFNLADSAITLGVMLMLLVSFRPQPNSP